MFSHSCLCKYLGHRVASLHSSRLTATTANSGLTTDTDTFSQRHVRTSRSSSLMPRLCSKIFSPFKNTEGCQSANNYSYLAAYRQIFRTSYWKRGRPKLHRDKRNVLKCIAYPSLVSTSVSDDAEAACPGLLHIRKLTNKFIKKMSFCSLNSQLS